MDDHSFMCRDGSGASVLDNAVWHALRTRHAPFAQVERSARRYDPDVSVFGGIPDSSAESWAALAELVGPGELAVLFARVVEAPPAGWTVKHTGRAHQMVFDGEPPAEAEPSGLRPLTDDDVPAMLELIALTQPGPFGPRTIELGGYYGVFDNGRLVAMAGQRLQPPGFAEISAVCTHPDAQRRGLGAAVTVRVARDVRDDGQTPFLHVAEHNDGARRVYERLGFRTWQFTTYCALQAPAAPSEGLRRLET